MSSRSWICFDCRKGIRREARYSWTPIDEPGPTCPDCGAECRYLGYKIRVPDRSDVRAWQVLREDLNRSKLRRMETAALEATRRKHAIEKKIAELKARPHEKERARLIRDLERRIEGA